MRRPTRSSIVLQKADQRKDSLQSISPDLDLGNGLTLAAYTTLIETLRDQISTYNSVISGINDLSRQIEASEKKLRDLSEQMLLGVAAKYGKDSREYGKAGGTPKSERRRPNRKQSTSRTLQPMVVSASSNSSSNRGSNSSSNPGINNPGISNNGISNNGISNNSGSNNGGSNNGKTAEFLNGNTNSKVSTI